MCRHDISSCMVDDRPPGRHPYSSAMGIVPNGMRFRIGESTESYYVYVVRRAHWPNESHREAITRSWMHPQGHPRLSITQYSFISMRSSTLPRIPLEVNVRAGKLCRSMYPGQGDLALGIRSRWTGLRILHAGDRSGNELIAERMDVSRPRRETPNKEVPASLFVPHPSQMARQ